MIAALGGMGKANQKLGNFYNKFFSEEEKNANLVKQMTTEFGKLGKELPTTRDGFKQMVLAAQATGDNQLLNSLLGFTDAMDSIYPVTEKATEGVEDLVSALKTSFTNYSDLQSQITQQENELKLDALNEQLDVVKSLIDAAKGLKEFIKSLKIGDLTILSPEAKLQEAKKQYADTLSKAKAGDEVAMQNLQGVSESYLSIAKDYYGSNAAYAAIFTEVSTGVETLANKTIDSQTKIANSLEKQIKAIETSSKATLDQLKAQLEQAKTQFYQDLSNTAKIVLSNDNVAAVLKTLPPELASALSSALAAAVTPLLKLTMGSNATSAAIAPALASSVGSGQTTLASAVSTSKAIIDALWLPIPMTTMKVNAATGEVKAFADGGYYQGGMALVGEQGPELINFRNPGQVYNNQQTKELLNDSSSSNDEETKVLLRALVTEVKALRNQQGLESSGQVTKLSSIERKLSSIESTGILEKSK
jgi:formate dehydrogenase maturation protein FdhE